MATSNSHPMQSDITRAFALKYSSLDKFPASSCLSSASKLSSIILMAASSVESSLIIIIPPKTPSHHRLIICILMMRYYFLPYHYNNIQSQLLKMSKKIIHGNHPRIILINIMLLAEYLNTQCRNNPHTESL